MIKFIVLITVFILALVMIAYLMRKKHMNEIFALEDDKLQIQHQPIFEELTKLKRLNMTGETEEKFERWRQEWTEVIDEIMPRIDGMLFDAEDALGRLNFKKATHIEREIMELIVQCDKKREQILKELDELIGSEEKSRIEIEALKESYRTARQTILAKQYDFGNAYDLLEKKLEQFVPQFEQYETLTKEGNYITAREIVLSLTKEANDVFDLISKTPSLLSKMNKTIPATLKELRSGMQEMESDDYDLQHLEIEEGLQQIEEALKTLHQKVEQLELESIEDQLLIIEGQFEAYYDALEGEVKAKVKLQQMIHEGYTLLNEVVKETERAMLEADYVQRSYQLSTTEAMLPESLLKRLNDYRLRYDDLLYQYEHPPITYSVMTNEVERLIDGIEQCDEEISNFMNKINSLRIDENRVKEQLEQLERDLQEADRLLVRSNLPGIPADIEGDFVEAGERIFVTLKALKEVPIHMEQVEQFEKEATAAVESICERVEELLHNVVLIEAIIQYGNRYRLSHPKLDDSLTRAEEAFRDTLYTKAFEEAATAVEEVEPGAMKRIERIVEEQ